MIYANQTAPQQRLKPNHPLLNFNKFFSRIYIQNSFSLDGCSFKRGAIAKNLQRRLVNFHEMNHAFSCQGEILERLILVNRKRNQRKYDRDIRVI